MRHVAGGGQQFGRHHDPVRLEPGVRGRDVLRDRDTNADGTLDERLYATHDANSDVTGLTDTAGDVVERFIYDPCDQASVLDDSWAADADGTSDYGWQYLHQGGRLDTAR